MNLQDIKNRFEIVGNSPLLNLSLETAIKVAPTEMTVLINGESGVGKENFSKIIHTLSNRKHGPFIAVNCGAIPEGTIDSELFGHEKGAYTGAHELRKGYFETVNGGTIFLDEVGELPLETQARLLRVLESGEFIKVGSSKSQKTDVRVVAATNRDLLELTKQGKFREDLYYRLNTVPIKVPALRDRGEDVVLLFRKFAQGFAEKYKTQPATLQPDAAQLLINYRWPGNIRQLKNITEQLSVLENEKSIVAELLYNYLPKENPQVPALFAGNSNEHGLSERDIFYKVLYDLRRDMNELKQVVYSMMQNPAEAAKMVQSEKVQSLIKIPHEEDTMQMVQPYMQPQQVYSKQQPIIISQPMTQSLEVREEPENEVLSLEKRELEFIKKALEKYKNKRRSAARELGISERTLYRKIKQYDLDK